MTSSKRRTGTGAALALTGKALLAVSLVTATVAASTAGRISPQLPGTITGELADVRDVGSYPFTVSAPGLDSFAVEVTASGRCDLALAITTGDGDEVHANDGGSKEHEYLTTLLLPPGEYLLRVSSQDDAAAYPAGYTIKWGPVAPVSPDEVNRALTNALDYLAAAQQPNGSFPENRGDGAAIPALAIQALVGAECLKRNDWETIYRSIDYILLLQAGEAAADADEEARALASLHLGGIVPSDGLYDHGIALIALLESYVLGARGGIERAIPAALDYLLRAQATGERPAGLSGPIPADSEAVGGWRYQAHSVDADLSVTAWQIIALVSAQKAGFTVPKERLELARACILRFYDKDTGGFRYELDNTHVTPGRAAMGALSLQLLGGADTPEVKTALRFILTHAPSWGSEYNGAFPFYYWYYGTRAAYLAGGDTWTLWSRAVCGMLIRHQQQNGAWQPMLSEKDGTSEIYTAALGALILEFCCGSIPIYMQAGTAPLRPTIAVARDDSITVEILKPSPGIVAGMALIHARATVGADASLQELIISVDGQEILRSSEPEIEMEFDFAAAPREVTARGITARGKEATARISTLGPEPISVDLTATVTDADNNYILDLQRNDFHIFEDGVEQQILRFSKDVTPVSMAVVLDTSGSMKQAMNDVQEAAAQFVSQIRPVDRAMVIEFADAARVVQPFTSDTAALMQSIRHTVPKGGTALYDALIAACQALTASPGRAAIVVLTDGKDENNDGSAPGSNATFDECLETVRGAEITVYALGLGKNVERSVLEGLALASGGRAYFPPTVQDVQQVYGLIATELRSQYSLGYSSTNFARDGAWRIIELTVPGTDYIVRTKTGYYAPGGQSGP